MTSRSIETALAGTMATGRVPGLAAAVVADGVLQGTAVAGTADVRTSVPVSVDTAFLWFSMTKIATATATLRLVERGVLALDDEVAALVPGVLPPRDGDGAPPTRPHPTPTRSCASDSPACGSCASRRGPAPPTRTSATSCSAR
jgi:CubicO group peptidase (beta-lactamase class C family)